MLSIIVALSENGVIGRDNQLPWRLSADLKRVKSITMGHHIIMGRKTYESMGRPLPGRTNVVITRQQDYKAEGCVVVSSLEEALRVAANDEEAFIFGGGEIFRKAIHLVDRIYITRVHVTIDGDVFFPELKKDEWTETEHQTFPQDEKNEYGYSFITLERKRNQ